jgi:hypothetical protein
MKTENALIAEFMGAVGTPKYNPTEWDVYITGVLDVDSDNEDAQHFYTPDEMKYHTSWDWLIPVANEIIKSRDEQNSDWDLTELKYALCTTNIDWVYNAVINFINKYNK